MSVSFFYSSSSKFITSYCRCYCYVEAVGGLSSLRVVWYQQPPVYALPYLLRYTVSLVSHYDYAPFCEFFFVDVLAVEQCAIDRNACGKSVEELSQVGVGDDYTRDAAHCGLHGLGIESVGGVGGAKYLIDSEPVGDADYRAEVAWVLHPV